jgi:hypothetical protein
LHWVALRCVVTLHYVGERRTRHARAHASCLHQKRAPRAEGGGAPCGPCRMRERMRASYTHLDAVRARLQCNLLAGCQLPHLVMPLTQVCHVVGQPRQLVRVLRESSRRQPGAGPRGRFHGQRGGTNATGESVAGAQRTVVSAFWLCRFTSSARRSLPSCCAARQARARRGRSAGTAWLSVACAGEG